MTRRSAAILGVLALVAWPAAGQVVVTPAPWVDGSGVARGTVTVPTGSSLLIAMAPPSTLAATPSQDGTDLAAGVYTITITALDAGGGETDDPTAITCTVAAGGAGRCALTWDAVPGAVSYRVWTSLVDVATPTRYFAAYTNAYNLDTLTGATVATLPTVGTAYVVSLSPTTVSWLGGPLYLEKNAISTTTTSGLSLVNNTIAASGVQQWPPGLSWIGRGWKTNATAGSQILEARTDLRITQGTIQPTFLLATAWQLDNSGSWTDVFGYNIGTTSGSFGANGFTSRAAIYLNATSGLSWYAASDPRTMLKSPADGTLRMTTTAETGFNRVDYGTPGAATTSVYRQTKVTAIADNAATTVLTVTIPNAAHAAAIRLMFLSSNGGADAFESSRAASGMVVFARVAGAVAVATAATIDDAAIATVGGGATHTLAYAVSAVSGGATETNTFTITVTIDDSGNLGSNQVVVIAELLNAEATGITIS